MVEEIIPSANDANSSNGKAPRRRLSRNTINGRIDRIRRFFKWCVSEQLILPSVYDALRTAGYAADIRPAQAQGKHTYDVRLSQLPSKAEAQALADALRGRMGVTEPKVSR